MTSSPAPHLLVLEPDLRGHTREWLEHLIEAVHEARPVVPRLSLAVPAPLADELAAGLPHAAPEHIHLIRLSRRETRACNHRRLAVSGLSRWWVMRRHLRRSGATHGLFLALDHLSLPLALGLGGGGRPLSGILFRPSIHYPALGAYHPTRRERLRDIRKDLLYRMMLRNPSLAAVLSLDPYFPPLGRKRYHGGHKIIAVPDPVAPMPEPDHRDHALAADVPGGRMPMALFGELTERKGVLPLLAALELVPERTAESIAVIIAGRVDPELRPAVEAAVTRLHRIRPALWLRLVDRRLSGGEITALIRRSRVVLAPYQRFVGSSGILLWAARLETPVLCQDYGLLGRLVRDYRLGITVDSTSPRALALEIEKLAASRADLPTDTDGMAAFCAGRTPECFAGVVLGQALEGSNFAAPSATPAWSNNVVLE